MWMIYFTILVTVSVSFRTYAIGESCGGREGYTLHEVDKNTYHRRCCKEKTCSAGSHPVVCAENDKDSTRCEPCADGWYSAGESRSGPYFRCYPKSRCDDRVQENQDDPRSDVKCLDCDLRNGYYSVDDFDCLRKSCPSGHQLTAQGECVPCSDGYFKTKPGYTQCETWTNCAKSGMKRWKNGTAYADVTCRNLVNYDDQPIIGKGINQEEYSTTTKASDVVIVKVDSPSSDTADKKDNRSYIALCVVAAVIIIILITVAVWYSIRKRRKNYHISDPEDAKEEPVGGSDVKSFTGFIVGGSQEEKLLQSSITSSQAGSASHECDGGESKTEMDKLLKSVNEQSDTVSHEQSDTVSHQQTDTVSQGSDGDSGVCSGPLINDLGGSSSSATTLQDASGSGSVPTEIGTDRKQLEDLRFTNHDRLNITDTEGATSITDNTLQGCSVGPDTVILPMNIHDNEEVSIPDNTLQNCVSPLGKETLYNNDNKDCYGNHSFTSGIAAKFSNTATDRYCAPQTKDEAPEAHHYPRGGTSSRDWDQWQKPDHYPINCSEQHPTTPCHHFSSGQKFLPIKSGEYDESNSRKEEYWQNVKGDDYSRHLPAKSDTSSSNAGVVIHIHQGDTIINETVKTCTIGSPSNVQIGDHNSLTLTEDGTST